MAWDTALNKIKQSVCLEGAYYILAGEKTTNVKTWHRILAAGEGQAEKSWEVGCKRRAWRQYRSKPGTHWGKVCLRRSRAAVGCGEQMEREQRGISFER